MWPWKKHVHDWEPVNTVSAKQIADSQPNWEFSSFTDVRDCAYETIVITDEKERTKCRIRPHMVEHLGNGIHMFGDVTNQVCLTCGECQNNAKLFVDVLNNRAETEVSKFKAEEQRKKLAEKMWMDGCHGKS